MRRLGGTAEELVADLEVLSLPASKLDFGRTHDRPLWIDYYANGHCKLERVGQDERLAETVSVR